MLCVVVAFESVPTAIAAAPDAFPSGIIAQALSTPKDNANAVRMNCFFRRLFPALEILVFCSEDAFVFPLANSETTM